MVSIQPEWPEILRVLRQEDRGTVYVMGAPDRGKSTFCRYLVERLVHTRPTAYLDCDTGQSTIGPPTTIGLAIQTGSQETPERHLRFTGSTSPRGHTLQVVAGTVRLLAKAKDCGARTIVVDSSGYVLDDAAQEFQFQLIDLLQPDHLVAFQSSDELEGILANFRHHPHMLIHRVSVPVEVVIRLRGWRRSYRERQFREYFADAKPRELSLDGIGVHGRLPASFRPEAWHALLIGLCDWEHELVALGVVDHLDLLTHSIRFISPAFDEENVTSIHVGSMRIEGAVPGMEPKPGS